MKKFLETCQILKEYNLLNINHLTLYLKSIMLLLLFSNIITAQTKYNIVNQSSIKLDGKNNTIVLNNNLTSVFKIENTDTVIISNYNFISENDSNVLDKGIFILNSNYIRIENCIFKGFNSAGISILHNDTGTNCIINKCLFIDNYKNKSGYGEGYGISIFGNNLLWIANDSILKPVIITNCYFTGSRHAIAGGGNALYECYNNVFYNNYYSSHVLDGHPGRNIEGYNKYGTRLMIIHDNLIYNDCYKYGNIIDNTKNATYLTNNGVLCFSGKLVCYNNYIKGFRFGIGLITDNINSKPHDCRIYNNTFYKYEGNVLSKEFYNFSPFSIIEGIDFNLFNK